MSYDQIKVFLDKKISFTAQRRSHSAVDGIVDEA
jgi:hypothetical protein